MLDDIIDPVDMDSGLTANEAAVLTSDKIMYNPFDRPPGEEVCFLSVLSVCVFCLCFLSVFSVCVFCLCFLSVFSLCVSYLASPTALPKTIHF